MSTKHVKHFSSVYSTLISFLKTISTLVQLKSQSTKSFCGCKAETMNRSLTRLRITMLTVSRASPQCSSTQEMHLQGQAMLSWRDNVAGRKGSGERVACAYRTTTAALFPAVHHSATEKYIQRHTGNVIHNWGGLQWIWGLTAYRLEDGANPCK